jgi:uncharacterized protein YndB with AHSA1/START domain
MTLGIPDIDPKLDLMLERVVDVPPALVWKCWTEPEHLVRWFTPKPWQTTACKIDLRPGGLFHTEMKGPEGESFSGDGCYLEVEEYRKLTWTNALLPGYRPAAKPEGCGDFFFTAMVFLTPEGDGTRYTAIALHNSETDSQTHKNMGFEDGWSTALNQLIEHAKTI